ncbi:MAG: hypothetical protein LBO74_02565, partial [Candidatus Symbiothrix sp.]|nr:hypothetical protein [Candidatus Symbiothrix sp.]
TENGYYEGGKYYFYIRDHLGNNRIVADENANIVQSTEYYPFGMPYADGIGRGVQPYKFGGKELEDMNGLNLYDFEARMLAFDISRFMTIDPLAEKYYSISPYAYCGNNPIKYVDPDGKDLFDFRGNFIARDNTHIIRVINRDGTETTLSRFYAYSGSNTAVSNILSYYGNEVGITGRVTTGSEGTTNSDSGLAYTQEKNVYVNTKGSNINELLDNTENMKSTLFHEKIHQERGHGEVKLTDAKHSLVYGAQITDSSFKETTDKYKQGVIGSFVDMLQHSDLDELNNSYYNTIIL